MPAPPQSTHHALTRAQQTQQALNKPFNAPTEPYEQRQKRDKAAGILDNVETLLWYSAVRNESISQTRQHFTNILLGINAPEEDRLWKEEWEVPVEDRVRTDVDVTASPKGKGSPARKDREKGKERRKRLSEGTI